MGHVGPSGGNTPTAPFLIWKMREGMPGYFRGTWFLDIRQTLWYLGRAVIVASLLIMLDILVSSGRMMGLQGSHSDTGLTGHEWGCNPTDGHAAKNPVLGR